MGEGNERQLPSRTELRQNARKGAEAHVGYVSSAAGVSLCAANRIPVIEADGSSGAIVRNVREGWKADVGPLT
jgi:hypothetical protein